LWRGAEFRGVIICYTCACFHSCVCEHKEKWASIDSIEIVEIILEYKPVKAQP
jgi:hypothetical protein